MTDTELDEICASLKGSIHWSAKAAKDAIIYLRAQLAERDAIGVVLMRERAIDVLDDTVTGPSINSWVAIDRASNAIKDIPLPTHAEQLAHALTMPEIKALLDAAEYFKAWDHCWPGNINLETAHGQIDAALAQMEGNTK